jgi:hypothetical protein
MPLRGFADRAHFASSCQNGAAAFMDRSVRNDKSAPFQRKAKGFVSRDLLRINPDDQRTSGTQELRQPIKRDLQGSEWAPPPVNQRYLVLAAWMAAVCRGCRASIATAMQLQHQRDGFGPGHDDSVLLRAACKRNHRLNNSVASGILRGRHNITCFRSFSAVRRGPGLVEIDLLRSGKASVLSTTPFVGLQTACHARLLDLHGLVSSGRD